MNSPDETMVPDLQAALACEDVRVEVGGCHTLVGVIGVLFIPHLPVRMPKFCLWTRWCSGVGTFSQHARVMCPDESTVLCSNNVTFTLPSSELHATNVHFFGGLLLSEYGLYHVEILLDGDLRTRFPITVARPPEASGSGMPPSSPKESSP
jgi:hypothetical protein